MTHSTWSIVESRGRPGLEQLEADWRRLYAQIPLRTSFLSYEACLAHVDHFMTTPDQLRCLALVDGRQVRAICLLEPRRQRLLGHRVALWGVLQQWHARQADVLCPDDEARRELVPALVAYLRRNPDGRRLLLLGPAPAGSALWEGLRRLGRAGYYVEPRESVHALDCGMAFDELRASLPGRFRQVLNRAQRKLAELPDVRFVTVDATSGFDAAFSDFLDVEASGWKGDNGTRTAVRCRKALSAFFHDLGANLRGDADYCEIVALYSQERCIAASFATRTGATYSGLKIGYDEAYGRVSPGQLVVEKMAERCCRDPGIARLDMVSDAAWVRGWRPDLVPLQVAYVVIDRWPRYLITAALAQLGLGPARRLAGRLRARRAAGEEPA